MKFQYMARPIFDMEMKYISKRVGTCLILHNMCVSDRVMGDPRTPYNPFSNQVEVDMSQPDDLLEVQERDARERGGSQTYRASTIGVNSQGFPVGNFVANNVEHRQRAWRDLKKKEEHQRLHKALLNFKGT